MRKIIVLTILMVALCVVINISCGENYPAPTEDMEYCLYLNEETGVAKEFPCGYAPEGWIPYPYRGTTSNIDSLGILINDSLPGTIN